MLGPPGSGKGTISNEIRGRYGAPIIQVGTMLREEAQRKTPFGERIADIMERGDLIPDDVVLELVYKKVSLCKGTFISDGFPRTLYEAEMFDQFLHDHKQPLDCVLYLDVEDNNIAERIRGRMMCTNCGCIYHETIKPPKIAGICDTCGKALEHRSDDTPETITHRLEVYHKKTEPVVSYYQHKGMLVTINGNKSIKEVAQAVFDKMKVCLQKERRE